MDDTALIRDDAMQHSGVSFRKTISGAALALIAVVLLPGAGIAGEIVTYKYDALGRIISSDARSSTPIGGAAVYAYDASGNRTSVEVNVVKFTTSLYISQTLAAGQSIVSDDGSYRLTLQHDGNLILFDVNGASIWNAGTTGGTSLVMQGDGNLVIYNAANAPLWSSNTAGHPGSRFAVQSDGNLVVYDSANLPIWARFGLFERPNGR